MIVDELKRRGRLYALAAPGFAFLLVFAYLPMFGHLIAFKRYRLSDGLWGSRWVGFDNFKFFFGSADWIRVTANTLLLNSLFIAFGIGMSVLLAVFLNEMRSTALKRACQSLIFLPYFISWMVVGFFAFAVFKSDGIANRLMQQVGGRSIDWFLEAKHWRPILTLIYVWKFSGYHAVIFLAAITSISPELYESARIDGAGRIRQIVSITLPLISQTVIVIVLLQIGRIFFGDFGMIYGIVGDNALLYPTTDVIDTYSFRALRNLGNFSMASAVVLYQSIMGVAAIVAANALVRRVDENAGLF